MNVTLTAKKYIYIWGEKYHKHGKTQNGLPPLDPTAGGWGLLPPSAQGPCPIPTTTPVFRDADHAACTLSLFLNIISGHFYVSLNYIPFLL